MTKTNVIIGLLIAFIIGMIVGRIYSQDALQGPYGTVGGQTIVTTQMPSTSVRYLQPSSWFTDQHPVDEGVFGFPTDDPNHIYAYHLNHWRSIQVATTIQ